MRGLERRQDALALGEPMERGERLLVRRGHVLGAARIAQRGVLRPDTRVVEAGRDRVCVEDLPVGIGEHGRARAVENCRPPRAQARRTGGLDADEPHVLVVEEACEEPDRVRPSADARDDRVREPVVRFEHLLPRFTSDDRLQLTHDARVRRRADAGADEVVRRLDIGDPVADRLARRLLQRLRAELDGSHLGAEEPHALDVRMLPAHVLGPHVHDALEPEARTDRRGRDPVLARTRLGHDASLAKA